MSNGIDTYVCATPPLGTQGSITGLYYARDGKTIQVRESKCCVLLHVVCLCFFISGIFVRLHCASHRCYLSFGTRGVIILPFFLPKQSTDMCVHVRKGLAGDLAGMTRAWQCQSFSRTLLSQKRIGRIISPRTARSYSYQHIYACAIITDFRV